MGLECREAALAAGAAVLAVLLALGERERRRLLTEASELRSAATRQQRLRDEERRGRTRAEQRLRDSVTPATTLGDESGALAADSLPFSFHPIGTFSSCYRARSGTPRQGGVVPDCLAVLKCSRDLNPKAALEGFEAYSHCWVLYVFHENTNTCREHRTVSNRNQQKNGRVPLWQGLCMKVAPPRCPELRVGVLACRTPHRPNPIGLSLAQIVHVDSAKGEVTLAGLDVVDGTPCLDLKPYLPTFESRPDARMPDWVKRSYDEPLMIVSWSAEALELFDSLVVGGASRKASPSHGSRVVNAKPFASPAALKQALEGTLALDIRSPHQKSKHPNPAASPSGSATFDTCVPFFVGDLWFHQLHVTYALYPLSPTSSEAPPATVSILRVDPRSSASDRPETIPSPVDGFAVGLHRLGPGEVAEVPKQQGHC